MFSDIGGLNGMTVSFMLFFVNFVNTNELENHMVTKLFRAEKVK